MQILLFFCVLRNHPNKNEQYENLNILVIFTKSLKNNIIQLEKIETKGGFGKNLLTPNILKQGKRKKRRRRENEFYSIGELYYIFSKFLKTFSMVQFFILNINTS